MNVSVVVLARNEESRLAACLSTAQWAGEIIVVDDHSDDATAEIARSAGARVLTRRLDGFASQKNFGIDHAEHEWVFVLDADELMSALLISEIQALEPQPGTTAYSVPRRNHIGTRWMKHGGLYPDRQVRLLRRDAARYGPREIHEMVVTDGDVVPLTGHLEHFTYDNLREYLDKVRLYAPLEARATGRRPSWPSIGHGLWRRLVVQRGMLDGYRGVASALLLTLYDVIMRRTLEP